jgi:hypothetical protein
MDVHEGPAFLFKVGQSSCKLQTIFFLFSEFHFMKME